MTIWVVDTSPLIFLSKLDYLHLLCKDVDEVYVPQAVFDEVQAKPDEAAQIIKQTSEDWLSVQQVSNRRAVEFLLANLDLGEAEAIALAREVNAARIVMDDLDARRFARRVGLNPVGTVGLLLAARLRGELPSLREEIKRLESFDFRITPALVEVALREAGET